MYRPLPVVTQQPKTKCGECLHVWTVRGDYLGCDLRLGIMHDIPESPPTRADASAGRCEYFEPTPWVRLVRWLGLREVEMLTFIDGEDVSTSDHGDASVRVEIHMSHEVAAYCELGSQPPGVPPLRYIRD